MSFTPINAINAYQNAIQTEASKNVAPTLETPVEGPNFSELVEGGVKTAIQAQKTSEKVSADAVLGKAEMTDVLQAVNDADSTLQMVLAIRNRAIEAYQQILRMPI